MKTCVAPELKQSLKQEALLSVQSYLQNELENLLEFAYRHGFRLQACRGARTQVIVGIANTRFIHPDLTA